MPKCQEFYPDCQWTVTHCWPHLALDTVLLPRFYWSYPTHIVRVCFTTLLKPTLERGLKRKCIVQINFNSPAMASLYKFFCYFSLENFDPNMDDFLTFINPTLSSPFSSPAISTVLPEAAEGDFNKFWNLRCSPLTNFGMCNCNITEYVPRRGLVRHKTTKPTGEDNAAGRSCSV